MHLHKRFFKAPRHNASFFIFGPRGTGKSTWIAQNFPKAIVINLLDEESYRTCLANPGHLKALLEGNPHITQYVIDEVQKAPKILDGVHDLIEKYKTHQFILTGSSARKLKRTGVNLLASRALLTHFHPFMASELEGAFDLNTTLKNGLIPLILSSPEPSKKMAAYISLYLKEEVQSEGLVRELGTFSRFLETISFSHGCILNVTNIARDCQVSRKIIENYISILEDLLLGYKLEVFTKRAKRAHVQHPKFYLFDCGVYYHLRPKGPIDSVDEIPGIALEGLVLQNLKAWCDYSDRDLKCYFWRTPSGTEVDFIIYGEETFYAIEVKHSTKINTNDIKALKTFISDYPEATPILLYRGKEQIMKDGVLCYPVEKFLLQLKPNQWPT